MPAPGQTNPDRLPARITAWLADNPGEHRARDVADGLGIPDGARRTDWSQKVANALGRLARDGAVIRQGQDLGHKKPVGVYSAAPAPVDA